MKRLALVIAMIAALLLPSPVMALSWPANSFSSDAAYRLEALIKREHYRVCDRKVYRRDKLKAAARWRAKDMIVRDYFSHIIKGTDNYVWDYFYKWDIHYRYVAEIIAWNTYGDNESADMAFKQFMGSSPHRSIIQSCKFTRLGAGAYQGSTNKHMFVVIFTRPP